MSTRGGMNYHRKLQKNTKALAMDGSNSLRLSEGVYFNSIQANSKRSDKTGRVS